MSVPLKRKDYATAILLNLLFPGAGYIYAGRTFLGVVVILLWAGAIAGYLNGIEALSGVAGFLAIIGAIDGYLTVRKHNDKVAAAADADLVTCPNCAERIQKSARICRYCQRAVAA